MMYLRLLSILLLTFALTGAPFGMGRMMDSAHSADAAHTGLHAPVHHGQESPVHKSNVPHYMACAACAATTMEASPGEQLLVLQGALVAVEMTPLTGIHALPLTPPPRA